MKLPNLSNSMSVAEWRYIQHIHEGGTLANPDGFVKNFIPLVQRWRCRWIKPRQLRQLRRYPFYYYLVARTKYYDDVFQRAIDQGVRYIVNVGCGTDTRAYRYASRLRERQIEVLECDQEASIVAKQRIAQRWRVSDYASYLPIDLNQGAWPELQRRLAQHAGGPTLVLMEGVSPYIDPVSFDSFLTLLAKQLAPGSRIAYDYKLQGVADDFGRAGRSGAVFRLSGTDADAVAFHARHGLRVEHHELSSALTTRLLPGLVGSHATAFAEDGLLQLTVAARPVRVASPGA